MGCQSARQHVGAGRNPPASLPALGTDAGTQKMLRRGPRGGMSPPSPALNQAAAFCPQWVEPGLGCPNGT